MVGGYFLLQASCRGEANWHPFVPPPDGHGNFGWGGIPTAAASIFFAYIGFDAVSTAAQEAKNPKRDMPIGILGSLVVCTILYILVSLVLTGLVSYKTLNVSAPVALAIDATGVGWGSMLVKIGAVFGLATVMLVMLLGQTRVFYSMSKDGLLPKWASAIHPKFRTPWITTIVFGAFAAIMPAVLQHRHTLASSSTSALCWPSPSCARACGFCACAIRRWSGPSRHRWCRWCRFSAFFPRST